MSTAPAAQSPPPPGKRSVVALLFGTVASVLLVLQAYFAWQHSGTMRDVGWRATRVAGGWSVDQVAGGGPAHGRVAVGDRVLSVDGHATAARIGPHWFLGPHTAGRAYTLRVARPAGAADVRLRVGARADRSFAPWAWMYFVVALVYMVAGLGIFWRRAADDPAVRFGYYACLSIAAVMLHLTSRRDDAALVGAPLIVSQLLLSVYPLHFLFGYLFLARFPTSNRLGGRWRYVEGVLAVGVAAAWASRLVINAVTAAGDRGIDAIVAHPWIALAFDRVAVPAERAIILATCVACVAVSLRNYRALADESQRRRLRWVAAGLSVALVPIAMVQGATLAVGVLSPGAAIPRSLAVARQVANGFVVVQPLAMAYAVLRHRVMGIHVVVRMGVQYVLAKTVLQAVLMLPLASLLIRSLRNPARSVPELLLDGPLPLNAGIIVGAGLALRYRARLSAAIDARFFREAYDQERVLLGLIDRIPTAESTDELSQLVATEIDHALHVGGVHVLYHDRTIHALTTSYFSDDAAGEPPEDPALDPDGTLLRTLERSGVPTEVRVLASQCTPEERDWLTGMRVELVVPVPGVDGLLRGLVLLGPKRSEEPYTPKDRALLRTVAAQVGSVHEVLALREVVSNERRVQHEVLARMDDAHLDSLRECPRCGRCYGRGVTHCADDGAAVELTLPIPPIVDGRYRLDRRIGRGGMGAVFQATDTRLKRPVAVKVMLGYMFGSHAAQRRFQREGQASALLEHRHIVRTYDYGVFSAGGAYLVLELVHGSSWRQLLDSRQSDHPARGARLLAQLCDGVAAAHAAGVIHRDLKPENVLIARDADGQDCVKVLDFGLARMRVRSDATPDATTSSSAVPGTVGYIAPELLDGALADERSDVYALGVIALETLARDVGHDGRRSFHAVRETIDRAFAGATNNAAARELAVVLRRGTAATPDDRFQSVLEFRAALIPAAEAFAGCPQLAASPQS